MKNSNEKTALSRALGVMLIVTIIALLVSCKGSKVKQEEVKTGTVMFSARPGLGDWYLRVNNSTLYEIDECLTLVYPVGEYTFELIGSGTLCAPTSGLLETIQITEGVEIITNVHCGADKLGK